MIVYFLDNMYACFILSSRQMIDHRCRVDGLKRSHDNSDMFMIYPLNSLNCRSISCIKNNFLKIKLLFKIGGFKILIKQKYSKIFIINVNNSCIILFIYLIIIFSYFTKHYYKYYSLCLPHV